MKKNILWMMAAILSSGLALGSCTDSTEKFRSTG